MTSSSILKSRFEAVQHELDAEIRNFPWEDARAYGFWLAQTHYYTRVSTRLIALTSAHFKLDQTPLHHRFAEYLREEKGHEQICLKDLREIRQELGAFPQCAEIAALYMCQYYWIEKEGPISFYGFILCLEGMAVRMGAKAHERVVMAHGKNAGNFLRVHVDEDVSHLEKAFHALENLSEKDSGIIIENMEMCAGLYIGMLRRGAALAQDASSRSKKAA